jgi:hypothetical protein
MSGIYVMFAPDAVNGGEHIRKWSREPFEGATEFREAPAFVNDTDLGSLDYAKSWPRPATRCDLVPLWAGEFQTFDDWVNFATKRLTGTRGMYGEVKSICVDARGRRCSIGGEFMRARDEDAFPVRYFFECVAPAAEREQAA